MGGNAIWLTDRGWKVTAVYGTAAAIEILKARASNRVLTVETKVADLAKDEFQIVRSAWDLVVMCYYLQRNLFEQA